jgi:hypothetical protein
MRRRRIFMNYFDLLENWINNICNSLLIYGVKINYNTLEHNNKNGIYVEIEFESHIGKITVLESGEMNTEFIDKENEEIILNNSIICNNEEILNENLKNFMLKMVLIAGH